MINLKIREFQTSISNFVDASDIPVEVKRLVLCDIARKVEEKAGNQLMAELKEREAQEVKDKDAESVQQSGNVEELPG